MAPVLLSGSAAATAMNQASACSAYAELLQSQGEAEQAEAWFIAVAAADPDNSTGAIDRLGVEFFDLEDEEDPEVDDAGAAVSEATVAPEVVEELPEDAHGLGASFDDEVEAEVAELLGEIDPPDSDDGKH